MARIDSHPLRTVLAADGWLVIDTETTGRGDGAEVVELALVDPAGEVVFESLIRPSKPVSAGAERLHGLTAARLAAAPRFCEIRDTVREVIDHRVLVAYPASFDRRVLAATCVSAGVSRIPARWECALDFYESLRGFRPPLATACEIEGVEVPERRHRAATDAVALQRLLVKLRVVDR